MHASDATHAPGLTAIVFWSMMRAAALAISIQTALCLHENLYEDHYFQKQYITQEAAKIAAAVDVTGDGLALDPKRVPRHYSDDPQHYSYRIATPQGRIIAVSGAEDLELHSPLQGDPPFLPEFWIHKLDLARLHFAGGMELWIGGQEYWVEVATRGDPAHVWASILAAELVKDVGLPMVPLVLISVVFATLSVHRALRPLAAAAAKADRVAAGDGESAFPVAGLPREAASFVSAINDLIGRLNVVVRSQKAFLSHAAHELKTPLAIMQLELGRIADPVARQLEADIVVMGDIVEHLLVLAKMEAMVKPDVREIDIDSIARQVVERLAPLAQAKGTSVRLEHAAAGTFRGELTSVYEALRNLVENAIHHTPTGSTVVVKCGPGGRVSVEDDGTGLPDAVRANLFEPFRKGSGNRPGAGLGLAIVRRAVEVHNGTIEAGNSCMGGARFRIDFGPAALGA